MSDKLCCPHDLVHTCISAGRELFPRGDDYARAVGRLLFATAAHESDGFKAARQYGFGTDTIRGAWSVFQLEWGTVQDSLLYLNRNVDVAYAVSQWAYGHVTEPFPWEHKDPLALMRHMQYGHRTACAFARLHYWRRPGAVPNTVEGCAAYWKQHYNTHLGKGTVQSFLRSWNTHAAKVWQTEIGE